MSWRGIDGAIAAAKAGHDTVLSPAPDLYFDHWQSPGDTSPGRSNTLSLKDVYLFNPLPAAIQPEQRKHVLGLQANLWAEMMRSEARVTYMAYPRIAALAEVAWSPPERINWENFQKRLEPQLRRYATLGIGYARETPVVPGPRRRVSHDLEQCGGGYLLSLEDDAPIQGERAVFLVNITDPCWIWRGADLSQVKAIRATVGQIPFNFQIGKDAAKIPLHKPATKYGELEIRLDDCKGKVVASASLEPAVSNFGLTPLPPIDLPSTGRAARHLLQIHASQDRSHLGRRQPRAHRLLTMPLIIRAPFAGWCAPLRKFPMPPSRKAMLGDGVASIPPATSCVRPAMVRSSRSPLRATRSHCGPPPARKFSCTWASTPWDWRARASTCTCARATACTPATCCSPSISTCWRARRRVS